MENILHLYGIGAKIMTPDGEGRTLVIYPKGIEVSINVIEPNQVMTGMRKEEMHYWYPFDKLKLLLRPLSSMTEEEKLSLFRLIWPNDQSWNPLGIVEIIDWYLAIGLFAVGSFDESPNSNVEEMVEWMNFKQHVDALNHLRKNGFDCDNLIPEGKALDATKQN